MKIRSFRELKVYQLAYELVLEVHELSKSFPVEEKYSLTDQMRRSSRSVLANIAEAWRKRRYPKHFISKLSDVEAEATENRFRSIFHTPSDTLIKKPTINDIIIMNISLQ